MALTIAIDGKGVIANCDALTNDTGGTGTGEWSEQGGGTMTLTTDVFLYGSSSIAGKYAAKSGLQQFDLGAGNELDFSGGGTEEGQFIFMWVNMAAFGVLDTLANTALAIRVSSASPGTSDYKDFTIAGNDGANGWTGGWKLFVIDPTKTASRVSGTCDLSAIRTLGVWVDTLLSVRAESLFIDQIAVGSGIKVTGTSNQGWKDVVDYCTDYSNRAWGMWQEREGIYFSYGLTKIGDSAQTAITQFKDDSRIIQFGTSEYYESSAWKTTYPIDAAGIAVYDTQSYATYFEDGIIVGTDKGRAGSLIVGNSLHDVSINFGVNNVSGTSYAKLYGTALKGCTGPIAMPWNGYYVWYGGSLVGCGQFNPTGPPKLRNLLFATTKDSYASGNPNGSALLWNTDIDIESCNFIANTDVTYNPHAIEHPAAGTFSYKGLIFSGNDYDIHFTPATGDLIINNLAPTGGGQKSNASTVENLSSGSVTFNSSFTHKLTGLKQNTEVTYTGKPTPYDSLTGLAFYAGSRVAEDIIANWTIDEFKGKLLVVSTAGVNEGRYYVVSNDETTITMSEEAAANQIVACDIYGGFTQVDHTEDVPVDGENEYIYNYAAGTYIDLLIFHVDYEDIVLEDINLGEADQTIPIVQIPDVNYFNPT